MLNFITQDDKEDESPGEKYITMLGFAKSLIQNFQKIEDAKLDIQDYGKDQILTYINHFP